jgi:MFS transporter, PAT family, beta-lactamase induction signal transducer AmpG
VPWTPGEASPETRQLQLTSWSTIFKSLYSVFRLRNSVLLAILLFICQGSFNYMGTLLPIFTVKELGWTNVSYSQFYAVAKLIGGIGGMLIGGILIDKFGKMRMMNIYFFLLILANGLFAFLKVYWISNTFISAYMIIYNVLNVFTSIGIFALAMECCWKKVSASQFTLYMTLGNLGRIALAALIGPINSNFSWQSTLFAFAIMIALAWLLLQFLNVNHHMSRVGDLERKDSGSST